MPSANHHKSKNNHIDDIGWKIATVPINIGDIGLAISIYTALSAYAASLTASHEQAGRILSNLSVSDLSSEQEVVAKGEPPQSLT